MPITFTNPQKRLNKILRNKPNQGDVVQQFPLTGNIPTRREAPYFSADKQNSELTTHKTQEAPETNKSHNSLPSQNHIRSNGYSKEELPLSSWLQGTPTMRLLKVITDAGLGPFLGAAACLESFGILSVKQLGETVNSPVYHHFPEKNVQPRINLLIQDWQL